MTNCLSFRNPQVRGNGSSFKSWRQNDFLGFLLLDELVIFPGGFST